MILAVICLSLTQSAAPLDGFPTTTCTKDGRPGDPVNLRLVGSADDLVRAFCSAGWSPAEPITARSAIRIGTSVVLNRPYPQAPVSNLYLYGRVQDFAFECILGSARSRHHVRFWLAGCTADGRQVWAGAGTFDARVGRSPATGRITHRISPDVDTERDTILADLGRTGGLTGVRVTPRLAPFTARNGEGDCYYTDGGIGEGNLTSASACPGASTGAVASGRMGVLGGEVGGLGSEVGGSSGVTRVPEATQVSIGEGDGNVENTLPARTSRGSRRQR
jgi:hypothetical protein